VLAGGLGRPECEDQAFPHHIEHRFARVQLLVDRAESAPGAKKARHRVKMVARLLGKTAEGIDRLAGRRQIASDCAATLAAMLAEGERRAVELAIALR
jgi:hypothetical protein